MFKHHDRPRGPSRTVDAWKETGQECCELDTREGCELDEKEGGDEDLKGEADGDTGGIVDDEPSLGSLDRRMNQAKWGQGDYTPKGCWGVDTDCEDDGLVRGEGDELDKGEGPEDTGIGDLDGLAEQVGSTYMPMPFSVE